MGLKRFKNVKDNVDPHQSSVPPEIHRHRIWKRISEDPVEDRRVVEDGLEVGQRLDHGDVEGVFGIAIHPAQIVKLENEEKLTIIFLCNFQLDSSYLLN